MKDHQQSAERIKAVTKAIVQKLVEKGKPPAAQLREQIRAEAAKLRAKYGRIAPALTLETDPGATQGSKTTRAVAWRMCALTSG